jgi:glycosyltransferase involved in cell wall biosynthesis
VPKNGPWGGGNIFLNAFVKKCYKFGLQPIFSMTDTCTTIFCLDPRQSEFGIHYGHLASYKRTKKSVKIFQRVGDLGTHGKPEIINMLKGCVDTDCFIFPSNWAKNYFNYNVFSVDSKNSIVIDNGADNLYFDNRNVKDCFASDDIIKLVTHHWSDNVRKGFSFYKQINNFFNSNECHDFFGINVDFTYIGRKPENIIFNNYISPLDSGQLSICLPKYDLYVTASEEEAGANHVLEAQACGLPVMYKTGGGSIKDYCSNYGGIEYDNFYDFLNKLKDVINNFLFYKNKVLLYNNNVDNVVDNYLEVISSFNED